MKVYTCKTIVIEISYFNIFFYLYISINLSVNFPIKLNNKLAHLNALISMGDYKPTNQMLVYKSEIFGLIDVQLTKMNQLFNTDLKELNQLIKQSNIDFIHVK